VSHKATLIVFTSPVEGREDEYNDWYDNTHLAEFTALPGVVSGQRFKVSPHGPKAPASYAALYELDGDPAEVLKAFDAGIKDGSVRMTDAVDLASVSITAWDTLGNKYPAA
jgi:hypothetical protein